MLSTLKEETKEFHSNVEKVLVTKLKNISSMSEYESLLAQLYYFYEPIEKHLPSLITEDVIPDIKKRKHVPFLKLDLEKLNHEFKSKPHRFIENINSLSYALGVLYVIEGSTLGGQVITGMLKKQLNLTDNSILAYYNSYGDNTFAMWNAFKLSIDKYTENINRAEMLKGAKDTFDELKKWLLEN